MVKNIAKLIDFHCTVLHILHYILTMYLFQFAVYCAVYMCVRRWCSGGVSRNSRFIDDFVSPRIGSNNRADLDIQW